MKRDRILDARFWILDTGQGSNIEQLSQVSGCIQYQVSSIQYRPL